jgi:CBS domain-containing protein
MPHPDVAGHVMRTRFPFVPPSSPLAVVESVMDQHNLDLLPVLAPGPTLAGVVLRRDLHQSDWSDEIMAETTAAEVLHEEIAPVGYDEDVPHAVERMATMRVTALPVESPGHRIEGLLVLRDLPAKEGRLTWLRQRAALRVPDMLGGLGLLVIALAIAGFMRSGPRWVTWVNLAAGGLALLASLMVYKPFIVGVGLAAFLGFALIALFTFCVGTDVRGWLTWPQLVFGLGFLALFVTSAFGPDERPARLPSVM